MCFLKPLPSDANAIHLPFEAWKHGTDKPSFIKKE
jgi:hypothetical protein